MCLAHEQQNKKNESKVEKEENEKNKRTRDVLPVMSEKFRFLLRYTIVIWFRTNHIISKIYLPCL